MEKIEISYDMINQIQYTDKSYRLKKIFGLNGKTNMVCSIPGLIIIPTICLLSEEYNVMDIARATLIMEGFAYTSDVVGQVVYDIISSVCAHKSPEELAMDKIRELSRKFNLNDINTTPELLLSSSVSHKEYHITKKGLPGIVRERYINVPIYDHNGNQEDVSIKEEHRLGSRDYTLTLDKPRKELVYRKVYNS